MCRDSKCGYYRSVFLKTLMIVVMSMVLLIAFKLGFIISHVECGYVTYSLVLNVLEIMWFCIWHRNSHNNGKPDGEKLRSMVTYLKYTTFDANCWFLFTPKTYDIRTNIFHCDSHIYFFTLVFYYAFNTQYLMID